MAGEWPTVRLGDVSDLLTGFPFKSEAYTEDLSAPRLVRGDNIAQGVLRWDGVKRWPKNATDDVEQYWLMEGDVILAMDRPWIEAGLKYAAVRKSDLPALLVQRVACLRGTSALDTSFLKYIIGSRAFTEHVLAVQTGTAVPHISGGQIKSFEFRLPPIDAQRAISHILGTLDDKIELNRRMNETLEAMARAIFKSWFVDFDPVRAKVEGRDPGLPKLIADLFPDRFEDSELGELPAGWEVRGLDKVANYLNGLALQKFPPNGDDTLPAIKIAQLHAGHTKGADRVGTNLPPEYVIEDGDVLFSWSGSLEVEIWCGGRGALNQHLFKVTSAHFPKWFYYLWTRHHLSYFQDTAADKATTMGHIQRHHLTEAKVLVPPSKLLEAMNGHFVSLMDRLIANRIESHTLATLRDTLLPKLISGEIRLKAAERIIGSNA